VHQEDINLVSEKDCEFLKTRVKNGIQLYKDYQKFRMQEPRCSEHVDEFIEVYSKIAIALLEIPEEVQEDVAPDEVSLEEALYVSEKYDQVGHLLACMFAAGVAHGQARFGKELYNDFVQDNLEKSINEII